MQGLIIEKGLETGFAFWLGLNDLDSEGLYVWENSKRSANFTAWGENEPSGVEEENCIAATQQHFYFWSDENCHDRKSQPVCESAVRLDKCFGIAAAHYNEETNRCYLFDSTYYYWSEAVEYCQTLPAEGAHLVRRYWEGQMSLIFLH